MSRLARDGAEHSEAGANPALSLRVDGLSSEEGRLVPVPPQASQRTHFVLRDPGG